MIFDLRWHFLENGEKIKENKTRGRNSKEKSPPEIRMKVGRRILEQWRKGSRSISKAPGIPKTFRGEEQRNKKKTKDNKGDHPRDKVFGELEPKSFFLLPPFFCKLGIPAAVARNSYLYRVTLCYFEILTIRLTPNSEFYSNHLKAMAARPCGITQLNKED